MAISCMDIQYFTPNLEARVVDALRSGSGGWASIVLDEGTPGDEYGVGKETTRKSYLLEASPEPTCGTGAVPAVGADHSGIS